MTAVARQDVEKKLIAIINDMTSDWELEYSGGIQSQTRLVGDLSFESIEIVQLLVEIESRFEMKNMASERLLMEDGRYVSDLTIAEIAGFICEEMQKG